MRIPSTAALDKFGGRRPPQKFCNGLSGCIIEADRQTQALLRKFPNQRQGQRTLAFERISIQRIDESHQGRHVARKMSQQVMANFGGKREAALGCVACERRVLFAVVQTHHFEDETPAETRAQIFPLRGKAQGTRRRVAGDDQDEYRIVADRIDGVEQRFLCCCAGGLDVVDRDDVGESRVAGSSLRCGNTSSSVAPVAWIAPPPRVAARSKWLRPLPVSPQT